MHVIGSRARPLPAPPRVVRDSLVAPLAPSARAWLALLDDEVAPRVLEMGAEHVVWSSLWPSRPRDEVHLDLAPASQGTLLRFTLLTPDAPPDASKTGHLRRRLNQVLFADLRFSYGQ